MSYIVKEIYYTLQGEGANTGQPAIFCRFSGCNLWSGREKDREKAVCQFCDTDFIGTNGPGGGKFSSAEALTTAILNKWPPDCLHKIPPFVVCTGGEPLLQVDRALIDALHQAGCQIAVETNGTILPPAGIDWICVSPKANAGSLIESGDELKLIYPQEDCLPEQFETLDYKHFFLQPLDGPFIERNIKLAMEYCLQHPRWRLSLQTHKILSIP